MPIYVKHEISKSLIVDALNNVSSGDCASSISFHMLLECGEFVDRLQVTKQFYGELEKRQQLLAIARELTEIAAPLLAENMLAYVRLDLMPTKSREELPTTLISNAQDFTRFPAFVISTVDFFKSLELKALELAEISQQDDIGAYFGAVAPKSSKDIFDEIRGYAFSDLKEFTPADNVELIKQLVGFHPSIYLQVL